MGTAAQTRVIRNHEEVYFRDSYDGYFSCQGKANLLGIKLFSVEQLRSWFDKYNQSIIQDEEGNGDHIPNRNRLNKNKIKDFIFLLENKDAKNYIKGVFLSDNSFGPTSLSSSGFAPLLGLNYNPSPFTNYDEYDYTIDLDNETFETENYETNKKIIFSFADINKLSLGAIHYLGDHFEDLVGRISKKNKNDLSFKDFEKYMNQAEIEDYEEELQTEDEAEDEAEEEQQEQTQTQQPPDQKNSSHRQNGMGSFAGTSSIISVGGGMDDQSFVIHSANFSADKLKHILALVQSLPNGTQHLKNAEWGYQENGSAGIRFVNVDESIIGLIQKNFNIGFNIMSTTGIGYFGGQEDHKVNKDYSIHTLEEFKKNLLLKPFLDTPNQILMIYLQQSDIKKIILSQQNFNETNIEYFTNALLYQDIEILEHTKEQCLTDYPDLIKKYPSVPQFLYNAWSMGQMIGEEVNNPNQQEFNKNFKNSGLFEVIEPLMSEREKALMSPKTSKISL